MTMWNHLEDGAITLSYSEGNEAYLEKYKDKIGKDVVCDLRYGYSKMIKSDSGKGFTMWKVSCFDLCGSIPTAISNMLMRQGFKEFETAFD